MRPLSIQQNLVQIDVLDILPVEIWSLILHGLPKATLFQVAGVCRALNLLCSDIILAQGKYSWDKLFDDDFFIPSHLLSLLHISCRTPPLRRLQCELQRPVDARHLKALHRLISRYQDLSELDFYSDSEANLNFWLRHPSRTVTAFCDILFLMASRNSGPVVLVYEGQPVLLQPVDILGWYTATLTSPPTKSRRGRILDAVLRRFGFPRATRSAAGGFRRPSLVDIPSANISSIPNDTNSQLRGATLIMFSHLHLLVLGCCERTEPSDSYGECIPNAELSNLLPHLHLPRLARLNINADAIPPCILRQFLEKHQTLTDIAIFFSSKKKISFNPLCTPPLNVVALKCVSATSPHDMTRLLAGLRGSISVNSIAFPYYRVFGDAPMIRALFSLVASFPGPLALHIDLHSYRGELGPLKEEDKALLRTLGCVTCVYLTFFAGAPLKGFDAPRAMFPLLTLFPALARLHFRDMALRSDSSEITRLFANVAAALPNTSDIVYSCDKEFYTVQGNR
ncbi:hypothetical protein GGX14DRAFT_385650 [Mycena pura]|uniref:F-box domain-containing protein n=1 Tax=Mycena pura TaxID=153505 RepID=A0AAD7E3K8_9AGAR|nr:hypothetical protein GGX14DRAFT_385650 [Mycena pura]